MQTAAPQGGVGVNIANYAENGGALSNALPFPNPPTNKTGRKLLQAASSMPYADASVHILCQDCNDTSAMFAALNSSEPSQLFTASGEMWQLFKRTLCLTVPRCANICCEFFAEKILSH